MFFASMLWDVIYLLIYFQQCRWMREYKESEILKRKKSEERVRRERQERVRVRYIGEVMKKIEEKERETSERDMEERG